jgi:hypothetical protein
MILPPYAEATVTLRIANIEETAEQSHSPFSPEDRADDVFIASSERDSHHREIIPFNID